MGLFLIGDLSVSQSLRVVTHWISFRESLAGTDQSHLQLCIFGLAIPSATLMARQQHSLLVLATSAMGAVLLVPAFAFLIFCRIDDRFLWVVDPSTNNPHLSSPFVYGQILGALLYFAVGVTCQRSSRRSKRELGREEAPYHGFHEGNAKNVRP